MKNQELERKISELITEIKKNRVPVRPEKEWLLEKYERYRKRLEEREGRKLTRARTDERLYQELYHTAPLKYGFSLFKMSTQRVDILNYNPPASRVVAIVIRKNHLSVL